MSRETRKPERTPVTAAEWFVALDARPSDEVTAARLSSWLDRVWTRTVASTRVEWSRGARSPGPNARLIVASSSVSHG